MLIWSCSQPEASCNLLNNSLSLRSFLGRKNKIKRSEAVKKNCLIAAGGHLNLSPLDITVTTMTATALRLIAVNHWPDITAQMCYFFFGRIERGDEWNLQWRGNLLEIPLCRVVHGCRRREWWQLWIAWWYVH